MWYAGSLTGVSPKDRLLLLKEIPKGAKDLAIAMIIDPIAWAAKQMPSSSEEERDAYWKAKQHQYD